MSQPESVVTPKKALISVSDKSGIVEFAKALTERNVEIISTGGTFKLLKDSGIPVAEVSSVTDFPEMMDGRVKTLHPKIHGGILGRRGTDDEVMQQHGIAPIDLVVVNLYPFAETIAKEDCILADAIENIDIGGQPWFARPLKTTKMLPSLLILPNTMRLSKNWMSSAASNPAPVLSWPVPPLNTLLSTMA